MDLFNKRLINEYIEKNIYTISDKGLRHTEIIERIISFLKQDAFRTKEKSIQTLFLQRVFEEILGYPSQLSGEKKYNLLVEPTTDFDSTEPDGALGFFDQNSKVARAVIELKPSNIDLDKKQLNRKDNKSPVEQAFGYSYKFDGCKWVIVSNFKEIRLYNTERGINLYQKFNILDLYDENEFRKFYFIFNKDNLLSLTGESLIEKLTRETNLKEENITKEFYGKYKETRNRLYKQLTEDNAQTDKNLILEKTQKIIDRIIFISFCEDLGLLPYDILRNILKITDYSYDLSEYKLWNQLKGLFDSINIGNPNKNINKFNGGLFTDDKLLNDLNIKDEILKELIKISDYDFESELNVNILGHIFEQSISDIEEMKADINELKTVKKEGKRKKEGIYYTPEYITKYIVEQAVGGWIEDRKKELGFYKLPELSEEDYKSIKITKGKLKANTKIEAHINFWESYREILQNIKVLDPACGSGAFLIQAFDYLYKEGQLVNDEIAKLKKGQRQIFDLDKHILTNNIYGVDLNEESVEITKLSLWLKTANKSKELTTLDENIKCGNSIIDDPIIAGKKAFNWNEEFNEIFNAGGFDVIIGNPPYINVELVPKDFKKYYLSRYKTVFKRFDIFGIFIESGIDLLQKNGKLSFIVPSQLLNNLSYSKLRDLILNNKLLEEVCYVGDKIFIGVNNDVCIILLNKNCTKNIKLINALDFLNPNIVEVESNYFQESNNIISINVDENYEETFSKIFSKTFSKISKNFNIFQGIVAGNNEAYINNKKYFEDFKIEKDILKTIIQGKDFGKWIVKNIDKRIIYLDQDINIDSYPHTLSYLSKFKESLINSKSAYEKSHEWYTLHRPRNKNQLDIVPKIFIQRTRNPRLKTRLVAAMDEIGVYGMESVIIVTAKKEKLDLYHLIALLNSKLFNFLFKTKFLNVAVKSDYLKEIPIPETSKSLIEYSKKIINLSNSLFNKTNSAIEFLASECHIVDPNEIIKNFYKIEWNDFNKELVKQKIKLGINKKEELFNWFTVKQKDLKNLEAEIFSIENLINLTVYELYRLTKQEIEIIELNN